MYWYYELNVKAGEKFYYQNTDEASEFIAELIQQKVPFTMDQYGYTNELQITILG